MLLSALLEYTVCTNGLELEEFSDLQMPPNSCAEETGRTDHQLMPDLAAVVGTKAYMDQVLEYKYSILCLCSLCTSPWRETDTTERQKLYNAKKCFIQNVLETYRNTVLSLSGSTYSTGVLEFVSSQSEYRYMYNVPGIPASNVPGTPVQYIRAVYGLPVVVCIHEIEVVEHSMETCNKVPGTVQVLVPC